MSLHIRCDYCFEVEQTNIYEAFQAEKYKCTKCILGEFNMEEKLYEVTFTHVEETTYIGYVRANSEDEAYQKAEDDPFSIDNLEEYDNQGLEVNNLRVQECEV